MNRFLLLFASVALLFPTLHPVRADEAPTTAPPKGLRVLTAGHSFHVWMPKNLQEMAAHAKIEGHRQVDLQSIGGSQVIQHWNLSDDKNTDPLGHPRGHIQALATYCHFAVIYGRNPKGLPAPAVIARLPEGEALNRLLQQLAWDAVTTHPLSGVKATTATSPR